MTYSNFNLLLSAYSHQGWAFHYLCNITPKTQQKKIKLMKIASIRKGMVLITADTYITKAIGASSSRWASTSEENIRRRHVVKVPKVHVASHIWGLGPIALTDQRGVDWQI